MRILHVDPERRWGGGETQVMTLLRQLRARGHESRLAADPAGLLARTAAAEGIPVLPLRIANHVDVRAALHLRRLLDADQVVHFHTARAHALAPFCRRRGVRLVVTRRMDYVPAGGPYVRYLYNRAVDAVIAISAGVRDALVRVGVRAERIRVVPSGIEPVEASPEARPRVRGEWGIGAQEIVVLVPGALEARKGHAVVLAAVRRLAPTGVPLRLVFCGDGREAAALARAADAAGVPVRFAGFRDDMPACFAAADIVAMPSLMEGLGVAALEAMAAGRALVASRVGGLGEVIVHEQTGLLTPVGEPEALAMALARLAYDAALRTRLGDAGRAHVLTRYTGARMAEGTLACYGEAGCA